MTREEELHIQNLALLIRRLVVRIRTDNPSERGNRICDQAMTYLRKTGIASPTDILRNVEDFVKLGDPEGKC